MRILAFICLLILSGLTGLYSQDTGDVQVKSGYMKVPEGSLYYEEAGTGEPLIFIHGHSLDRRMWNEQFFKFAKHYRAIRYDLRGYGVSSKQTEDFQFTHAEDLVALMDALHIRKAHIVGLSLGDSLVRICWDVFRTVCCPLSWPAEISANQKDPVSR